MARQLSDVLHHLLPELPPEPSPQPSNPGPQADPALAAVPDLGDVWPAHPTPAPTPRRPILTIPVDVGELVRAALVWNLALELALQGRRPVLLAPAGRQTNGLWPRPGPTGGVELLRPRVEGPEELGRAALVTARDLQPEPPGASDPAPRGLVLVAAPPSWLQRAARDNPLLGWVLFFASPARRGLARTAGLVRSVIARNPESRICFATHATRSALEIDWIARQFDLASPDGRFRPRHCGGVPGDAPLARAVAAKLPLRELAADAQAAGQLPGAALGEVALALLAGEPTPRTGTIFGSG